MSTTDPNPTKARISVSLPLLAKMIDHSLLHPTLTDAEIESGLSICATHNVATACIKPYLIPLTKQFLTSHPNANFGICAVIGFPHGNSTTSIKVREAIEAVDAGAAEIDMVINVGKALGRDWTYVSDEINKVNEAVVSRGAILKVIFETDYLPSDNDEILIRLCEICTDVRVGFVKTSTGYGFVKDPKSGMYSYQGATTAALKVMRECCGENVQVKAAGGVRTLDDLLSVRMLGVTRVGATATVAILEEAKRRGIGEEEIEVEFVMWQGGVGGY